MATSPEMKGRIPKLIAVGAAVVVGLIVLVGPVLRGDIDVSKSSHRQERAPTALANGNMSNEMDIASNNVGPGTISSSESSKYYVFLQKFSLESTMNLIYHTEVIVCPRQSFGTVFQKDIDQLATSLSDFALVPEVLWKDQSSATCVQLGYGGASCTQKCCSSPHKDGVNVGYALNSRKAVISNADKSTKSLYFYGVSELSEGGEGAYRAVCSTGAMCHSNWSGVDYNPLTNNCNTFTSTVLKCVFGLSDKKPHLGVSDMVSVKCPEKCEVPEKKALVQIVEEDVPDEVTYGRLR